MKQINKLEEIPQYVIGLQKRFKVAVVAAEDTHTMEAVLNATEKGFVYPIFVVNSKKINALLKDTIQEGTYRIIDCAEYMEAASLAVSMVKCGEADIVMKGLINTDLFLKAVLNKQNGLMKPEGVLSYVCAVEIPAYKKLVNNEQKIIILFNI